MFDRTWLVLSAYIVILGMIVNQPAVLALPAFIFVLAGAGRWWQRRVLERVTYRRRFSYTHVFPGESIDLTLEARNEKRLPVPWLIAYDSLPPQIVAADAAPAAPPTHSFRLGGGARARIRHRLHATERGYYPIGPARLHSGDPFSLFDVAREEQTRDWLVVYPPIIPLAELGIPAKDLFGERRAHQRMFEDPSRTMGVRDYQPGDSFRHVHWKATAHQAALQTRVYEHTVNSSIMICLNAATFPQAWQGVHRDRLERAIGICASIAYEGAASGFAIGVAANCGAPLVSRTISVPPGRSLDQLMRVLEALAAVTHYVVTPFDQFLLRESPRLAWGATIVAVTALTTPHILTALTQLRAAGRRVVLVSVAPEPPPPLKDVLAYHLPIEETEAVAYGGSVTRR